MSSRALIASILLAICATPAVAQDPRQQAPPTVNPDKVSCPARAKISFNGGTLQQYRDIAQKSFPCLNIVIEDSLLKVTLPSQPMLPDLTPHLALAWIPTTVEARKSDLTMQVIRSGRDSDAVYVFTKTTYVPQPLVEDYAVKSYYQEPLEGSTVTPELVRNAMEHALSKQPQNARRTLEYNADTRTIFVTGTRADILVADRVVDDMYRGRLVVAANRQLRTEIETLQAEVREIKRRVVEAPK